MKKRESTVAELIVSKKKISQLLNKEGGKYVIPAYQRPYKWEKEECETLWLDLTGFYEDNKDNDSEFVLGTIVTCKPENEPSSKNDEVIDGQQRITSLLLLLRALYKKLESAVEDDNVKGLKSQIAPCIWDLDKISRKVTNPALVHIESQVATDEHKQALEKILRDGEKGSPKRAIFTRKTTSSSPSSGTTIGRTMARIGSISALPCWIASSSCRSNARGSTRRREYSRR